MKGRLSFSCKYGRKSYTYLYSTTLSVFHVKQCAPASESPLDLSDAHTFMDRMPAQVSVLRAYAAYAERFSAAAGLTGSGLEGSFLQAHVLPAIAAWRLIRPRHRARVADLGAGAGAFACSAAILYGNADVFAIDSSRRHCDFMEDVARRLPIENLTVLSARAEVLGGRDDAAGSFDIVGCRALAAGDLPFELAAPLMRQRCVLLIWRTCDTLGPEKHGILRAVSQLDLSQYSPRLTLTRYDLTGAA